MTLGAQAEELEESLRAAVAGAVSFDAGTKAMYSTDASNYRHIPIGVVTPRSAADVVATLRICHERGVPVLPRGAGTSVGGQATNVAVILDFVPHLNQILEIDAAQRVARVEPGVILDQLRLKANESGLTFGPDPSTHSRCTIGGMIGNNACGSHSVAWGKTEDCVTGLEIALVDGTRLDVGRTTPEELAQLCSRPDRVGELYRSLSDLVDTFGDDIRTGYPSLVRRVSGYNLAHLLPENGFDVAKALVGSEGTCATILTATVSLVQVPAARALVVLGFSDIVAAAEAVPTLLDLPVLTIEGIDSQLLDALRLRRLGPGVGDGLPEGKAWLYLETGGESLGEAVAVAETIVTRACAIGASSRVISDPQEARALWHMREEGAGLATRLPDGSEAWSGWEDAAVPPERLGAYLKEFKSLMERHGRRGVMYGHFGDGCLHVRIDFPLVAPDGPQRYRAFLSEAADLVVSHGGSLSGEHGDGQARAELLPKMFRPRLIEAFEAFKTAFDPQGDMNPHRVVRPAPLDDALRVVVAPPTLSTRASLALHADGGDLAAATRRCVGVGQCLSPSDGVMCPSYRASGQEKNSTRGRARLLFEMMAGEVITDGWRSEEVRDSLDLCLGCKACKTDCPVGVDMATYKVEFLSRHFEGRLRPRSHYVLGALPRWLKVASRLPRVVNVAGRSPLAPLAKRVAGIAPERSIPALARTSLTAWFRDRSSPLREVASPEVALWPDTFTNYFDPEIGRDAVAALEELGCRVHFPSQPVCCGLTWYNTGQLDKARSVLTRTLHVLQPWLEIGAPIIGLEPSCTAMLRNDAAELLPNDRRTAQLANVVRTFAEFVNSLPSASLRDVSADPTSPSREVLSQVHCHQHADLGYSADRDLLDRVAGPVTVLEGGCCGMAGNFGFERDHYSMSIACAEQELLPALREIGPHVQVHADGFSCRTQIRQVSEHEPVHLATLVARALGVSDH
ncbi:MAG: FAD-binding and (Fe-S)-binding domain-containing protein [Acidimicrobiales bacterium]